MKLILIMLVITNLRNFRKVNPRNLVLTLGVFDGVHRGHRKIISLVNKRALEIRGTSAVFTFREHPLKVISPRRSPFLLTSFWHKLDLLNQEKIKICILPKFNKKFYQLSPEEFVKTKLVDLLKPRHLYLGENAHFGYRRKGDIEIMEILAKRYSFDFSKVSSLRLGGGLISSSSIRHFISKGDTEQASKMLGRKYSILATVVKSRREGQFGFLKVELNPHSEILPPKGIFLVTINILQLRMKRLNYSGVFKFKKKVLRRKLYGLLALGLQSVSNHPRKRKYQPELYIFNYKGNFYNKVLEVIFGQRVKAKTSFGDKDFLKLVKRRD